MAFVINRLLHRDPTACRTFFQWIYLYAANPRGCSSAWLLIRAGRSSAWLLIRSGLLACWWLLLAMVARAGRSGSRSCQQKAPLAAPIGSRSRSRSADAPRCGKCDSTGCPGAHDGVCKAFGSRQRGSLPWCRGVNADAAQPSAHELEKNKNDAASTPILMKATLIPISGAGFHCFYNAGARGLQEMGHSKAPRSMQTLRVHLAKFARTPAAAGPSAQQLQLKRQSRQQRRASSQGRKRQGGREQQLPGCRQ